MTKYGVIGAGAVSRSLISRLPAKTEELGPVAAQTFRVASRMANGLRAGRAVRSVDELNSTSTILFCSNPAAAVDLAKLLLGARIEWQGKQVIVCESSIPLTQFSLIRDAGASVAAIHPVGLQGQYLVEGDEAAAKTARALIRKVQGKVLQLGGNRAALFQAGITLATALLTPRLELAAEIFRMSGLRDKQAMELAASIFEKTARAYGHSGRQSWAYHLRKPDVAGLRAEIQALQAATGHADAFLRELVDSFQRFSRHQDVGEELMPPLGASA